jgi:uncharacterized membrane protein YphA (DoxX/SURF4 family)
LNTAAIAFEASRVLTIAGFFLYGLGCLVSDRMVTEFERFGMPRWRRPTGLLEVAGALGLAAGYFVPIVGTLAAAGLTLLMLGAIATRIRIRDSLPATLPAIVFGTAIAYVLGYTVLTGR